MPEACRIAWISRRICSGATTGTGEVGLARRNVEGGGRTDDIRHTSYRGVVGVKGDVAEHWNYDVSATYSTVVFQETYFNDFSITRGARAMDVVRDPVTGQPTCRSVVDGSDPTCVPYNIWSLGGVTREALDYLQIPLFSTGDTELKTVTATMASDLGAYGIKSPAAKDGVGVAFGAAAMEVETAARVGANVVFVISNNGGIAGHSIQDRMFAPDAPPIAALLPVNYERMGEMVGGFSARVTKPADIRPTIERAIAANTVAVINVLTDPKGGRRGTGYLC